MSNQREVTVPGADGGTYKCYNGCWFRDEAHPVRDDALSAALDALLDMQFERNVSETTVGLLCDERDWYHDKLDAVTKERDDYKLRLDNAHRLWDIDIERGLEAYLVAEAERDEARGLVFDVFNQACQVDFDRETQTGTYDDMALSSYEDAQAALISWGVIKAEQCRRTT